MKKFTTTQKSELKKQGYIIYQLQGKSIKDLRNEGKKFWSSWHERYDFENEKSIEGEVAINPDKLFIPDSQNKTLDEQEKMVESLQVPKGCKAIMGNASDYCELAFLHLEKTKEYLFGENYDYDYTRTKTPVGSGVADVGRFDAGLGLHVSHWLVAFGNDFVHAAPLVVPTGKSEIGELDLLDSLDLDSVNQKLEEIGKKLEKMKRLVEHRTVGAYKNFDVIEEVIPYVKFLECLDDVLSYLKGGKR